MIEVNLEILNTIQAWLGTPINTSQPGVTYGLLIVFIIIIIAIAKYLEGDK